VPPLASPANDAVGQISTRFGAHDDTPPAREAGSLDKDSAGHTSGGCSATPTTGRSVWACLSPGPSWIIDPVYEGKSMAGLIDLIASGEIPKDSTVLYAHLGGQPALNAYSGIFD
jgi:hypothetical protein